MRNRKTRRGDDTKNIKCIPSLRRNYPVQVQRVLSQPSIESTPWTMLQIYRTFILIGTKTKC